MVARRSAPPRRSAPSSPLPESTAQATVPKTNKDPAMSLCPWSIEVALGPGQFTEIPAVPAVEWLRYLLSTSPDFDGLITNLMPELEDYYLDNNLDLTTMYQLALDVIGIAGARNWWIALRLIYTAAENWQIIGPKLMMNGIDPTFVSLAAWLDMALFIMIESMDPKSVTMFTLKLEIPPPSNLITGEVAEEELVTERSSFLAMAD